MSDTVDRDNVTKALAALNDIAKGHNSRGTVTTEVVPMSGVGGATQVYHTPSNSEPSSWAGSRPSDVDTATDAIDQNGTDYNGKLAAVFDKISKGLPVTAEELEFVKSATAKAFPPIVKDGKGKDEKPDGKGKENPFDKMKPKKKDDEEEEDDEKVSKGFEVSEFLGSWSNKLVKSLELMEARIVNRLEQRITALEGGSGEFQKSLANALSAVGETVVLTAQRMDQVESGPARAPLATQGYVGAMTKSMGQDVLSKAFAGDFGAKTMVGEVLAELVQKGDIDALDVVRYDSTGEISPIVQQKLSKALSGH